MSAATAARMAGRALAALLLVPGCSVDLGLSGGAQIACGDAGSCPEGTGCRSSIGMCVPTNAEDQQPPAVVGKARIEPGPARVGTTLTICFDVTEPLASPPTVRVDVGDHTVEPALQGEPGPDDVTFCFTWKVTGSEQSGNRALTADLVDRTGNVAADVALGSVVLDFAAPQLVVEPEVAPAIARKGTTLSARLVFDEALTGEPQVRMGPEGTASGAAPLTWAWAAAEEALTHVFTYEPTGDEAQGAHTVWLVHAEDEAGNTSEPRSLGRVVLDFDDPGILSGESRRVLPKVANIDRTVRVELEADEDLGAGTVRLAGKQDGHTDLVFEGGADGPRSLRFVHTVAADTDGVWSLVLTGLGDVAGNVADPIPIDELFIDTLAPEVSLPAEVWDGEAFVGLDERFTEAHPLADGAPLLLRFTTRERRPGEPDVGVLLTIDGDPRGAVAEVEPWFEAGGDPDLRAYEARYTARAADWSSVDGRREIAVEAVDEAGNSSGAVACGGVRLDFHPPEVVEGSAHLEVTPPVGLVQPGNAATIGSSLRLVFETNEPVGAGVVVTARGPADGEVLAFAPVETGGTRQDWTMTLTEAVVGEHDGSEFGVEVVAPDAAGNRSTTEVASFIVDTVAPPPPDPERVELRRSPWGTGRAGEPDQPSKVISGDEAATSAGSVLVIVADEVTPDGVVQVGVVRVREDGGFGPAPLAGADVATVFMATVDGAGNTSDFVPVENGVWVATLGGKVAGSDAENPHGARWLPGLAQAPLPREGPGLPTMHLRSLALLGDDTHVLTGVRGWAYPDAGWDGLVAARSGVVWDPLRGELLVFGGAGSLGCDLPPFWRWTGREWAVVPAAAPAPAARLAPAMVWDGARGRVVLFAGGDALAALDDTWEWDGAQWLDVAPFGPSPPARYAPAAAWDPVREVVLVHGGCRDYQCTELLEDLWAWDGARWTEADLGGVGPSARSHHAMAWDPVSESTVLFGGCIAAADVEGRCDLSRDQLGDTWTWDGRAFTRRCLGDAGEPDHCADAPTARAMHAMATWPDDSGVALFGGWSGEHRPVGPNAKADLWRWTGSDWQEIHGGDGVGGRHGAGLVGVPSDGRLYAVGGYAVGRGQTRHGELLAWEGDDWVKLSSGGYPVPVPTPWPRISPPSPTRPETGAQQSVAVAYHESVGMTVLFGRPPGAGATWGWDGAAWTEFAPAGGPGPDGRLLAGLAHDPAGDRTLLFGGQTEGDCDGTGKRNCDSLWALGFDDGGAATWELLCGGEHPQCRAPLGPRTARAIAWDPDEGRLVVFGGFAWASEAPEHGGWSPCPSSARSLETQGEQACVLADTWVFRNGAWTDICGGPDSGPCGPGFRRTATMAYDEARDEIVLFGGTAMFCGSDVPRCPLDPHWPGRYGDTWVLSGDEWEQRCGPDMERDCGPALRHGAATVWDPIRGRVLLFSGSPDPSVGGYRDVWEWDGTRWRQLESPSPPPPGRMWHAMAFDRARGRAVVFGGCLDDGECVEGPLELDAGPDLRPSLLPAFSWRAAGGDADAIRAIQLAAFAGGRGYDVAPDGGVGRLVPGAEVAVWDAAGGRWHAGPSVDSDIDEPSELTMTLGDEPARFVEPSGGRIHFRLAPVGGSGSGPTEAQLAVDYLELRVEYDARVAARRP